MKFKLKKKTEKSENHKKSLNFNKSDDTSRNNKDLEILKNQKNLINSIKKDAPKRKNIEEGVLIQKIFPIGFDEYEQAFIDKEGNYLGMLKISGTNIFSFNAGETQTYINNYQNCFSRLVGDFQLYSYQVSADIDEYMDVIEFNKRQLDSVNKQDTKKSEILINQQNFFNKAINSIDMVDREFVFVLKDRDKAKLNRRILNLYNALINQKAKILDTEEMIDIIYAYYNPYSSDFYPSKNKGLLEDFGVMEYIYPDSIKLVGHGDIIKLNNLYCKTLYAKSLNSENKLAFMSAFSTLPNIEFSLHFEIVDNAEIIKEQDKKHKSLRKQLENAKENSEQQKISIEIADTTQLIAEIQNGLTLPLNMTMSIRIKAYSLEDLYILENEVKKHGANNGVEFNSGVFDALDMFNLSAPICQNDTIWYRLTEAKSMALAYPLIYESLYDLSIIKDQDGNIREAYPPVFLGYSLNSGGPIFYDNFIRENDRINSNEFIVGKSGSGKTTQVMHSILQRFASNYKQYVIDVEGKELNKLIVDLEGQNINCSNGEKGLINPLEIRIDIPDDEKNDGKTALEDIKPLSKHIHFLRNFLHSYNESDDIKSLHFGYIEESLLRIYKSKGITINTTAQELVDNYNHNDYPIFLDLYNDLVNEHLKEKNAKNRDLAKVQRLEECTVFIKPLAIGVDSIIFNGFTNVDLDNDLICFDISGLLSNTENKVLKAQYYNILSFIWSNVLSDTDNRRKQIYCDEFHTVMDHRYIDCMAFMRNIIKRIRKYEGGLTIATQQIGDILSDRVKEYGESFIENSCYQFYYSVGPEGIKYLTKNNCIPEQESEFIEKAIQGTCYAKFGTSTTMRINVNIDPIELKYLKRFKEKSKDK